MIFTRQAAIIEDQHIPYQFVSSSDYQVLGVCRSLQQLSGCQVSPGNTRLDALLQVDGNANIALHTAFQTGEPICFRAFVRVKEQSLLPVYWTIVPHDQTLYWYGFPAEDPDRLSGRLKELELIVASFHDIVFELDKDGRFRNYWTRDPKKLFVAPTEFLGKSLHDFVRACMAPLADLLLGTYQEAIRTKCSQQTEYELPAGCWYTCRFTPIFSPETEIVGMLVIIMDVSSQRKLEISLRESEERYRDLFENAIDIIYILDNHGAILSINHRVSELLGYTEKELLGKSSHFLFAPEKLPEVVTQEQLKRSGQVKTTVYEAEYITSEGRRLPVEISSRLIYRDGEVAGTHVTARDMSRQRQAQQALAKSEAMYRFLSEHARDVICLHLPDTEYIYVSSSARSLLGYEPDELVGRFPHEFYHPDDAAGMNQEVISSLLTERRHPGVLRYRFLHKEGHYIWLETVPQPIVDQDEMIYVQTISRDISERKIAEQQLRQSEEWFRTLFRNSLDIVFVTDAKGRLGYATPSLETILGYGQSDLLGEYCSNQVHPDDLSAFNRVINTLATGTVQEQVLPLRIRHAKGHWCWMEMKGQSQLHDPNIKGILLSLRDIGEYIEIENTLKQYSDRITSVLHSITDGFISTDRDLRITMFNAVASELLKDNAGLAVGESIWDLLPNARISDSYHYINLAIAENKTTRYEQWVESLNRWFEVSAFPFEEGLFIYFRDGTEKKYQESLLQLEKELLEMNAVATATVSSMAQVLLERLEVLLRGTRTSMRLVKSNTQEVVLLAAYGLPDDRYREFVKVSQLDPRFGTVGRAVETRSPVGITSIANSDLHPFTKAQAASAGIQAVWSTPLLSAANEVLCVFSFYFTESRAPRPEEIVAVNRALRIFAIVLENRQAAEKLHISNERYILATRAANEAIWDWDAEEQVSYWGEGFKTIFGYPSEFYPGMSMNWENKIHPDDRERVISRISKFTSGEERGLFTEEYRFLKSNGQYAYVRDKAYCLYADDGRVMRMIGSCEDITETRRLQEQLLQQEIHKQQQIAQAVVDVQESERAEIGKELHDNVNQLLSTAKLFLEVAENDGAMQQQMIRKSSDAIASAIHAIRELSRSLMPASIGDLGLISSVNDLVQNINLTRQLKAEFTYDHNLDLLLPPKQKLMLFRVIQEQVNNILKHAKATNLVISISYHAKHIRLEITDDGVGFDLPMAKRKNGVGLSNIYSRAALFNGDVQVLTSPGNGCRLVITVPHTLQKNE